MKPRVLMVLGAYFPEGSGASTQCRELVRAFRDRVECTVLVTSTDGRQPSRGEVDGVPVYRVKIDPARFFSKAAAGFRLGWTFLRLSRRFDIVHLHGFSQKSIPLVLLTRLLRKKLVIKITSAGQDDPLAIRSRSPIAFKFFSQADLFFGVSSAIEQRYKDSGLPKEKFRKIPNGVDGNRFRPDPARRSSLRRELGLPVDLRLGLFVGFFSREKRPDLLFESWASLQGNGLLSSGLLFIGASRRGYREIDPTLAEEIRSRASGMGLENRLFFVERTQEIEKYYQAVDFFALTSSREGLPNVLLEAMASGLPCAATRLPGITDEVILPETTGLLFAEGNRSELAAGIHRLLDRPDEASRMGQRARESVLNRYPIHRTADLTHAAYQTLLEN